LHEEDLGRNPRTGKDLNLRGDLKMVAKEEKAAGVG
jgi:hypothetical protein